MSGEKRHDVIILGVHGKCHVTKKSYKAVTCGNEKCPNFGDKVFGAKRVQSSSQNAPRRPGLRSARLTKEALRHGEAETS